jgi:hypothetical protein
MRSLSPSQAGSRLRIGIVVALLFICSLLPAHMLGWAAWLADPVQAVIAPWQHTLRRAATWARARVVAKPGDISPAEQAALDEITRQRDAAQFALVQANAQIEELRKRIAEVSRGLELNNLPVAPVAAPVIGASPDLSSKSLIVRAGRNHNVEVNNVAVTGGVHIVGLVKRVSERTCTVLPITDPAAGLIDGRIMIGDTSAGPLCQLKPDGRGRLVGPVEDDPRFRDASGRSIPIEPGSRVRLFDRAWPLSAHGLIIGQVIKVEPLPSQPLRSVVTVEPIEPIETVREVTIRTVIGGDNAQPEADPASGGPR